MTPRKSTMLVVLLGLLLAVFAIGLAQSQVPQAKREASPSMDSCCCKGDSCQMKEGMTGTDKKDGCCCSGDSCDMKMKEGMKNHAEGAGGCCCCGDSCDMKKDANMKNHSSEAGCCCCSAESCEVKTSGTMSSQPSAHDCCCSKNHKNMQHMKAKQKAA